MSTILDEVRAISSQKIAEKQKASENGYPKLIEKIKLAAGWGQTECEFDEGAIDQYSKRLLEQDGFTVWATTAKPNKYEQYLGQKIEPKSIWIVRW